MTKFGPTWKSSHPYGQGCMNNKRKLYYCQIPKCASMWMREYLAQLGAGAPYEDIWDGATADTVGIEEYTPIIFLRDPMKRWLSNCPAVDNIVGAVDYPSNSIFQNFESWLWDEHSARQIDFIQWLDLSKAVFFYCDDNLSKNVEHYFIKQGFRNIKVPDIVNRQKVDDKTVASVQAWKQIFSIPKYLQVFQDTYAKDYNLINSVDFYRQGEIGASGTR